MTPRSLQHEYMHHASILLFCLATIFVEKQTHLIISMKSNSLFQIALCSAIFAGCAYVGYSVVRQAFGRNLVNNRAGSGRRGRNCSNLQYFVNRLTPKFKLSLRGQGKQEA